jgi:hypothetical protein
MITGGNKKNLHWWVEIRNYIDVLHYLLKHNQYCSALTRGKNSKRKGKRRKRKRRSTSNKAVMKITTLHLL